MKFDQNRDHDPLIRNSRTSFCDVGNVLYTWLKCTIKLCDNNTDHKLKKHNLVEKQKVLLDYRKHIREKHSRTPLSHWQYLYDADTHIYYPEQTRLHDQTNDQKDNSLVNLKKKYFELYKDIFNLQIQNIFLHVTALHAILYEYIKFLRQFAKISVFYMNQIKTCLY